MKQMQKWLCGLLVLCMVFACLPMTASAAGTGECGENLTWSFADGVVTVSGEGPMTEFFGLASSPFYEFREEITKVVIEEGVTTVGKYAFYCCENLSEVILPEGLTAIGDYAFYKCHDLADIRFPEGLRSIGNFAFLENFDLVDLIFPATLESIGVCAFEDCLHLRMAWMPRSLAYVGESAFAKTGGPNNVYYEGSREEWTGMEINPYGNKTLLEAKIQYNAPCISELPFVDVPRDSFYHNPILWALWEEVTQGMTATEFQPNTVCNRAQVVTFLWRAYGCPEPTDTKNPFTDVDVNSWYGKAVLWAVENGITNGISETEFGVELPCNRAQVVTFLWRADGAKVYEEFYDYLFDDVAVGEWYTDAVLWARLFYITDGIGDNNFGLEVLCNRAQIVTFLYRSFTR